VIQLCTYNIFWRPFHKWFPTSVGPATSRFKATGLSYIKKTNIFSITEQKPCIKIAPGILSFFISYPAIHIYCITVCIPCFQTKHPSNTVPFFRRSMYARKKFYCIDQWFLSGVCCPFRAVIYNLFRTATRFATQFNLTTPFQKCPVMHMICSCVCTIENHNDRKIAYDITMFNKDSFIN